MKIWYGYGSEHSANLVMIGHFKDSTKAVNAKRAIERLIQQVRSDEEAKLITIGEHQEHYTEGMGALLSDLMLYSIGPAELEQFAYDFQAVHQGNDVIIKTDETDVSALFKLLLDNGARVEIYSAHGNTEESDAGS